MMRDIPRSQPQTLRGLPILYHFKLTLGISRHLCDCHVRIAARLSVREALGSASPGSKRMHVRIQRDAPNEDKA
jgi:hypothetical protein